MAPHRGKFPACIRETAASTGFSSFIVLTFRVHEAPQGLVRRGDLHSDLHSLAKCWDSAVEAQNRAPLESCDYVR